MEKNNINAREIALKILYKIDKENAYSNIVLDSFLKEYNLENRDKAFISQLVYGSITYKITLDYIISKHSKIKLKKISDWILNILRLGVYQIMFLDKIPKRAIVNESVNLAKKYGHIKSSGFVNAMLKNISETELDELSFSNEIDELSIKTSHEKWFIEKLIKEYGLDNARKICEYNNIEPPVYIRINVLKTTIDEFRNKLDKLEIKYEDGIVPNTLKIEKLNGLLESELFKNGYFSIQDNAASLASYILNVKEGENVLDMCSSPGGKTAHMAEMMKDKGTITACDVYENRLSLVKKTARRLGITCIKTKLNDGTKLNNEFIDKFDKVLVDAPCSGLGVIRRKIDIKYQKAEEDIDEIKNIQYLILKNASQYVKLNGEIVYSTCTIFKEENDDIINKFLKENSNFRLLDISDKIKDNINKNGCIQVLPHIHNLDGFYIAKLERIS
ncbi:MAG: 16S rRNA (cytosine(967)-C(5))-methyltransferase RsmB [Clostridiales bacterium]|nr:16S rRNA (cytosine(967)-C(5))-methyltransferase RsmB [Clostridiales bacterium]